MRMYGYGAWHLPDIHIGRLAVQHWNARGAMPSEWSMTSSPSLTGGRVRHVNLGRQRWTLITHGRNR